MDSHLKYLLDYKHGKIEKGLGINNMLDDYIRHKKSELIFLLGHDNVGKSYWIFWYFLNICLRHNLKVCMYAGENQKGQILRDLIQMFAGVKFKQIPDNLIHAYCAKIEEHFKFIPNNKIYKSEELFNLFLASKCEIALIDPFTALDRDMSYAGNYTFLNMARQFVNQTGVTVYVNTHPISESGRSGNLYAQGHEWAGMLRAPLKNDIEGGKSFLNRCDNLYIIHRLTKSETMKYYTMISTEKIKDIDSGGSLTLLDEPVLCEFNNGLGFRVNGVDSLQDLRTKEMQSKQFPNNNFF